jgi:tetrahydromethanopterin S-methyltransferase subunit G
MSDQSVPLVNLSIDNALGEDYPDIAETSSFWDDIDTFLTGAWNGIKDNSIVGKLTGAVNKTLDTVGTTVQSIGKGVGNTVNIIPIALIGLLVIVGIYVVFMGKKGKAIV